MQAQVPTKPKQTTPPKFTSFNKGEIKDLRPRKDLINVAVKIDFLKRFAQ